MTPAVLSGQDAMRLEQCLADGGVAVFPADTVYGLCCDPDSESAVRRLYALKGRSAERPAAVMFFVLDRALRALPELEAKERSALVALLPGPVTVLLPNRRGRFPLACGPDPATLGLRVPLLNDRLAAMSAVSRPALQSSANLSGGPEARRLEDVSPQLRQAADLLLDGGELLGVASTVVDLRDYQQTGGWSVLREGALAIDAVESALA